LPPLLKLIKHYTSKEIKKNPPDSIRSSNSSPNLSNSNQTSNDEAAESGTRQSILLEIVINCTHTLYLLSRAGILSQKEVINEGVFNILLMLASFTMDEVKIDKDANEEEQQEHQQIGERVIIIQNLAAKAISAISSLLAFQASIIELIQGTEKFSNLLRSRNDEVRKYMAKTIAYLSLRNGKCLYIFKTVIFHIK
jgi:hypothetical protein